MFFELEKRKALLNELIKHDCIIDVKEWPTCVQFKTSFSDDEINLQRWTKIHYEIEPTKNNTYTLSFDIETKNIENKLNAINFNTIMNCCAKCIEIDERSWRYKFTFKIFNEFNAKQMIDEICELLPIICPRVNAAYLLSYK